MALFRLVIVFVSMPACAALATPALNFRPYLRCPSAALAKPALRSSRPRCPGVMCCDPNSGASVDERTDEALSVAQMKGVVTPVRVAAPGTATEEEEAFSYVAFAQSYPFVNNILIATSKTAAADLLAQTVIAQTPLDAIDWQRSLLFCLFGAIYLGGFQYLYQVQIFKRLFDVDRFTSQPWADKLRDGPGLQALAAQTALDLTVLTLIYLPTFYVFKAGVFSGSAEPSAWVGSGLAAYQANFAKDEFDLLRVWLPADLVCFSVPLYLRLPVRHVVSFVWTAYLSFARGGH
uniref:Uncharacterized protein n=1 Tax=Haptolina brevifila TaxID=156173 RepID=A0A7S2BPP1_9EUKA